MIIKQTVQHIKSIVLKQCSVTRYRITLQSYGSVLSQYESGRFFLLLSDKTLLDVKALNL